MSDNLRFLIVGAGTIAKEYVKVIHALEYEAIVVGRGEKNIEIIKQDFPGIEAYSGGLQKYLDANSPPLYAVVATPVEYLFEATLLLIKAGSKKILTEKPLTFSVDKGIYLQNIATQKQAAITVAFNRRSYASVTEAKKQINADGGVSSMHFNFTEAVFRINPENYDSKTREMWGVANSSHVIDTAFFLGGSPLWIESHQYNNDIEWHLAGSIFMGMGETENGAPFSYHADWGCPGKWNIEVMTPKRRLIFSPMEKLQQQEYGSFQVEEVDIDYSKDILYKPGFYQQIQKWINEDPMLCGIDEYIEKLPLYYKIFNYKIAN